MSFAQVTAGYRKANTRAVVLIAISALLLCLLYTVRLTHFSIATVSSGSISEPHPSAPPELTKDVYNRTLGFEKIFVINLPERTDRRDSITLSAALSNIDIEIVDAVRGENVLDKVIPHADVGKFMKAEIGCWRSHINIMQQVIQQNLSSILIIEDDGDWDVRIMDQLYDFALAAQALTQPLSPISHGDGLRHSRRSPSTGEEYEILFEDLPDTRPPEHSPYGDNWDLLWLGHCGITFPEANGSTPARRVVKNNDPTVPEKKFLTNNLVAEDLNEYPDHTRLTHYASMGLCTQSYAITQAGARDLMMSVGLDQMATIDFGLRGWCDGTDGRDPHHCLATQPALFQPHRKAGSQTGDSDIDTAAHGTEIRTKAMTEVVRWSTILNWKTLLGGGKQFGDQYPDEN